MANNKLKLLAVRYDSGMKHALFIFALFLSVPIAAVAAPTTLQGFGGSLTNFLSGTILSFMLAVALLVFIYNVIRFFIADTDSYDKKEKARRYMIWSVAGFVLIISIWGVVNLLVAGTNLGRNLPVCPDSLSEEACRGFQGNNYNATPPASMSAPTVSDQYSLPTIAPLGSSGRTNRTFNETVDHSAPPATTQIGNDNAARQAPQQFDPDRQAAYEEARLILMNQYIERWLAMRDRGAITEDGADHYIQQVTEVLTDPAATYEEKLEQLNFARHYVDDGVYEYARSTFEAMYASSNAE